MNIRFLGTGYGVLKSKKRNTKDFRRPASLLIDNEILIDPTNEVFSFAEDYGLTGLFRGVHTVLITTLDEERFSAETLLSLLKNGKIKALKISTLDKLCEVLECQPGDLLEYNNDNL